MNAQSTAVFFVNRTAELGNLIMSRKSGHNKSNWGQEKNIQHTSIVDFQKVFLPPLHITAGANEELCKSSGQTKSRLRYLFEKFPRLSKAKIKEGFFVGPQICKLLIDDTFDHLLHGKEKKAFSVSSNQASRKLQSR